MSVRVASSHENSMSDVNALARATARPADSITCSRDIRSLCSRWMSEVAMNTWMRGLLAPCSDSIAASMSSSLVRASEATTQSTACETARMPSTSPGDEIAKPASMMSTPSRSSWRAISTFSAAFSAMPGDCSPSRNVVSNIRTVSVGIAGVLLRGRERTHLSRWLPVRVRRRAAREQKSVALTGEEQEKAEEGKRERGLEPDRTPAQRGAGSGLLGSRGARHGAHRIGMECCEVKREQGSSQDVHGVVGGWSQKQLAVRGSANWWCDIRVAPTPLADHCPNVTVPTTLGM